MIVAMMFPPNAGRVCIRLPFSSMGGGAVRGEAVAMRCHAPQGHAQAGRSIRTISGLYLSISWHIASSSFWSGSSGTPGIDEVCVVGP